MSRQRTPPLGAVARGLAAGAIGTAVMTAWQELSAKLQASQEPVEESGGPEGAEAKGPEDPWEQASPPARVACRIISGVFKREVRPDWIPALTHGMHWAYGTAWGLPFGLIQGTRRRQPLPAGLLFGTAVWLMSYAQLVPMGLYEPPWKYPPNELALDLSYHLAYGAGVGAGYALLDRG